MDREGWKGSITVFLSISCILFLSLICAAAESARVQGARAQSANITGMGNFSLFSEYENSLLTNFEIFALDAAYGSGEFRIQNVNDKLKGYLSANANPGKNLLAELCTDPWKLKLDNCEVTKYQLLTDSSGEPFYQQAVAYMKVNAGSLVTSQLLDYAREAEEIKEYQDRFEEEQKKNDQKVLEMENQKQEKLQELQEQQQQNVQEDAGQAENTADGQNETSAEHMITVPEAETVVKEPEGNPLEEIKKLRKRSLLSIVTWDKGISEQKISQAKLPSRKISRKGTLKTEKEYSGLAADVLFREYLLMHFPNFLSEEKAEGLEYQAEYLIGGKSSDEANLKAVVTKLLLLREGMNYVYCMQDAQMSAKAGSLAVTFTGFLGIPALTEATKHALLLAWAYGESLIDVRILLDAGKIPVMKDADSWSLSLENLGKITEILQQGAPDSGKGLSYHSYLRILLNLGNTRQQKLRALDMIQVRLQAEKKTEKFKAENCITAVRTKAEWSCSPMFWSLPGAIMGTGAGDIQFEQEGSISYQ